MWFLVQFHFLRAFSKESRTHMTTFRMIPVSWILLGVEYVADDSTHAVSHIAIGQIQRSSNLFQISRFNDLSVRSFFIYFPKTVCAYIFFIQLFYFCTQIFRNVITQIFWILSRSTFIILLFAFRSNVTDFIILLLLLLWCTLF